MDRGIRDAQVESHAVDDREPQALLVGIRMQNRVGGKPQQAGAGRSRPREALRWIKAGSEMETPVRIRTGNGANIKGVRRDSGRWAWLESNRPGGIFRPAFGHDR